MKCEHLHHAKKDRHGLGEPCPVEDRLNSTTQLDNVQQAINWLKSDEVNAGPRTTKAISLVLTVLDSRAEKVRAVKQALRDAINVGWQCGQQNKPQYMAQAAANIACDAIDALAGLPNAAERASISNEN